MPTFQPGQVQTLRQPEQTNPPFSIEVEQTVLGSLMMMNDLLARFPLSDTAFYDPVHAEIFRRIKAKIDAGELASPVTMKPACANLPMHELGGAAYLVRLAAVATTVNFTEYCAMLVDLEAKRSLLSAMEAARAEIDSGQLPAATIAVKLEGAAGRTSERSSTRKLVRSYAAAAVASLEQLAQAYANDTPGGVQTGIRQLDRMLSNFRPGQMIILGARPSMGKTTVAQNIAYNVASQGKGVFYASLEMTGEELSPRFFSKGLHMRGINVPYNRMLRGEFSEAEAREIQNEVKRQLDLPMIIGEREVRDTARLRSAVKRAKQTFDGEGKDLGLVIIDYVQQLDSEGARSTYDRASAASDTCKTLAMTLGVPVLALAQLSRQVEQRDPPIPNLSDLRETGKLEEDADVVLFCYRDAYYLERQIEAVKSSNLEKEADLRAKLTQVQDQLEIIVAKQRSGPIGTVQAYANLAHCHIASDRFGTDAGGQSFLI